MTGPADSLFRYRFNGWTLESDRALPWLRPAGRGRARRSPDIEIRFADVLPPAAGLPGAADIAVQPDGAVRVSVPAEGLAISVEEGRRIRVDAASPSDAALHRWLTGAAMAVLAHQRGQPPLAAAVLEIAGHAVALTGEQPAVWSVAAAALARRGHRRLTDDVALIDPATLLAEPGLPAQRHWLPGGARTGAHDPAAPGAGDTAISGGSGWMVGEPAPLALIVALQADPLAVGPRLQDLTSAESAALLERHALLPDLAVAIDGGAGLRTMAHRIARTVTAVVLHVPDTPGWLGPTCDGIEDLVTIVTTED